MTKAEYLRVIQETPWVFPHVEGCDDPPPDWVAEAWDTDAVQGCLVAALVNDVSQNGELLCTPEFLMGLSAVHRTEQVLRLFHALRDGSPHREPEFRPQFEQGFARHAPALPPPLTREEVVARLKAVGFDEATAAQLMGEEPSDDGNQ
jgi:hypothetical protein